jgi:hypothetical protein
MPEHTTRGHIPEDSDHVTLSVDTIDSVMHHVHTIIAGDYTGLLYTPWAAIAQSI